MANLKLFWATLNASSAIILALTALSVDLDAPYNYLIILIFLFMSFQTIAALLSKREARSHAQSPAPLVEDDTSHTTTWTIDPDNFSEGILVTDDAHHVLHVNKPGLALFQSINPGFDPVLSDVKTAFEVFHVGLEERQGADQVIDAILSTPSLQFSERLKFKDGKIIERSTRPVSGNDQRLWILRDITHLEQANEERELHDRMVEEDAARTAEMAEQLYLAKSELEKHQAELTRIANTDMLTNLPNRRHFMTVSNAAFDNIKAPFEIWVIMFDIDFFKKVNDTFGHAAGDAAIIEFARILETVIGGHGTLGRMGGEEFAAVLPGCTQSEATAFAEDIRKRTEANIVQHDGRDIRYTASIGIARTLPGDETIEAALDRADSALYSAKQAGRNRVELHEEVQKMRA